MDYLRVFEVKVWQMVKVIALLIVVIVVAVTGFSLIEPTGGQVTTSAVVAAPSTDLTGYARAIEPRAWSFPRDYGAHRAFQTEWWYYTGNVSDETGRRFGYQFTIFRRAITPEEYPTDSEWRTNQVYLAHFTLSDIDSQAFYHDQRLSRGSADLAGALPHEAMPDAPYRVYIEDWEIAADDSASERFTIHATSADFAIALTLDALKPPALHGLNGLSAKSNIEGNASYYYSHSRLATTGTLTVKGQSFSVNGLTWKDHEFSTSALGTTALGWDWFGLHFDDGRDMMIGQIRLLDGSKEPAFGGLLIEADGTTRYLKSDEFTITAMNTWVSPHNGATYPAGWNITIPSENLVFTATPLQPDQELYDTDPSYWEGAVQLGGDVTGFGYAELTGYTTPMTRRF
jgi:predicted secreted hydrolase